MDTQDMQMWLEENWQLFILLGILLTPTILHFSLINAGYSSPQFITMLSINTWFKGVVGLGLGILFGLMITKKFG